MAPVSCAKPCSGRPHWNFLSCSFIREGTSLCSTRSNPPSADVSAASIASKDRRYGALGEETPTWIPPPSRRHRMRTRNTRPATCPWASTPRATSTARRAPARPRPQQPRALGQERGRVRQSAQEVGGEHGVVAAKRVKVWARPAAAEQGPGEPARVALAERDPGAVDAVFDGARQLTRHLAFPEARVPEQPLSFMSRARR